MQNNRNRAILIGLLLLFLSVISITMAEKKEPLRYDSIVQKPIIFSILQDGNDTSNGNFTMDTDNDPPVFIDWFDSQSLIAPNNPVLFWAIIEDIDNTSTELTVTLYYSNDSFNSVNVSQTMTYSSSPDTYQHRFTFTMAGQSAGTYYQYYYQAYDGGTYVKEDNSGLYYDIQWEEVERGRGQPLPETTVPPVEEIIFRIDWLLILALLIVMAISVFVIKKYQEKQEGKISW